MVDPTAIRPPPPGIDLARVLKQQLASLPQGGGLLSGSGARRYSPHAGDNIDLDADTLALRQTRAAVSREMDEKRWPIGKAKSTEPQRAINPAPRETTHDTRWRT